MLVLDEAGRYYAHTTDHAVCGPLSSPVFTAMLAGKVFPAVPPGVTGLRAGVANNPEARGLAHPKHLHFQLAPQGAAVGGPGGDRPLRDPPVPGTSTHVAYVQRTLCVHT
jgi:hypothetical protein